MNWLAVSKLPVLGWLLILAACQSSIEVGQPPRNMSVIFSDTFTVKVSTVWVDSVTSSNTSDLLVGQCQDPLFGKITAQSFFTLSPRSGQNVSALLESPEVGKLQLVLFYNYSYGDTTREQTIYVHRVTEPIVRDGRYYTFENKSIEATPLGSKTFRASALLGRVLEIDLADSFRDELLALLAGPDSLTQERLDDWLKGLALLPDSNDDAAILGFDASQPLLTFLRLRYKNAQGADAFYFVSMRVATITAGESTPKSVRFVRITADRAGSDLANIALQQPIAEEALANQAYIQGLLGICSKIEFPYIDKLNELGIVAVNQAYLIMRPLPNKSNPFYRRPQNLLLVEATANGRPARAPITRTGPSFNWTDTIYRAVQTEGFDPMGVGRDLQIPFDPLTQSYNALITSYMQALLNDSNPRYLGRTRKPNYGLFVMPNTMSAYPTRLVLGGALHPSHRLELQLFYSLVQNP